MKDRKQRENIASAKIFGTSVLRVEASRQDSALDYLAVEDPLEIVVVSGQPSNREVSAVSVTMRTPGNDEALAIGFLFAEGFIKSKADIESISLSSITDGDISGNRVSVELVPGARFHSDNLNRNFYMSSSCGVCGKASIDAVRLSGCRPLNPGQPEFKASFFHQLPEKLLKAQQVFEHTGGLHAAALFDMHGHIKLLQEDIGRHNAVDKLIGEAVLRGMQPLDNFVILVSGRISFELVQKALTGGIPVMAAVGAPSSLAVSLGRRFGMTLIGFVRDKRYNIYSGKERIK